MELIVNLQSQLEKLYQINRVCNIEEFVITDSQVAHLLDTSINPRSTLEKLLIHQEYDSLNLSLYLDESLLSSLHYFNPKELITSNELDAFYNVLEGVSHFVYLTFNANYRYPVSLFEMELQAEVDKFVMSMLLMGLQRHSKQFEQLYERLFVNVSYDAMLLPDELMRYQAANYYASQYCQQLHATFHSPFEFAYLNELRRFYRLNHWTKPNYIASACAA